MMVVTFILGLGLADNVDAGWLKKSGGGEGSIDLVMERVYPALVRIYVVTMSPRSGRMQKFQAAGSGVVVRKDGYLITNHHVAGQGIRFICRMSDGEEIPATLTGTDALADIAVLKLDLSSRDEKAKPLTVAMFGDSDAVKVGDVVYAMGSPAALSQSVTRGIVSNTAMIMSGFTGSMRLDGERVGSLVRWIAHDASIFGGNSGGPLVDKNGKIIGINEIGVAGLSGAIPSNLAKNITDQLIKNGSVKRSWVGLSIQPILKEMLAKGVEGGLVGGVIKGSPAEKAGLLPGDIVTKYNGASVHCRIGEDIPAINAMFMGTPIGTKIKIEAVRDGKKMNFELCATERGKAQGENMELKSWGMTVRDLTRLSALVKRRPDTKGVLVITMSQGGPALDAKPPLKYNDIILKVAGEDVPDIETLAKISKREIGDSEERVPVLVEFIRGVESLMTVVEIGKQPEREKPALARKAWLPIVSQVLTRDLAKKLGLKNKGGVRITQLYPDRTAEAAGLLSGDILLALDGTEIEAFEPEDSGVLHHMVRQYKVGAEVELDVIRDGKPIKIKVKLDEPATPTQNLDSYKNDYFEIKVREISLDDRLFKRIDSDINGVLVDKVERASWAALGNLRANDVLISIDGRPTPDVDTVEEILDMARMQEKKRLIFFVSRGINTLYLELEPGWDEPGKTETEEGEQDDEK